MNSRERFCVGPDEVIKTAQAEFGVPGDRGRLESALAAPNQTFGGKELFPDVPDKVAVLFRSWEQTHGRENGFEVCGNARHENQIKRGEHPQVVGAFGCFGCSV